MQQLSTYFGCMTRARAFDEADWKDNYEQTS